MTLKVEIVLWISSNSLKSHYKWFFWLYPISKRNNISDDKTVYGLELAPLLVSCMIYWNKAHWRNDILWLLS